MMRLLLALLLCLQFAPATAHRLNLFATSDGSRIDGYVYFPGGGRAADLPVRLTRGETLIAEQRSDGEGRFSFALDGLDGEVELRANSGDGHLARFAITLAPPAADLPGPTGEAASAAGHPPATPDCSATGDDKALQAAIAAQIRPLREQLDALAAQRRWQDVVGGIGYILGLFGLAALFYSRRRP